MKNLLAITGIILFICIIITSSYRSDNANAAPEQPILESQISQVSDNKKASTDYFLSVYEKKVAAFETGKDVPFYISDVYINTLPAADIELLEKGIYVKDKKALKRLIEDYCSWLFRDIFMVIFTINLSVFHI